MEPEFEWDAAKRSANLAKHGIDFDDIGAAFRDSRATHGLDTREDYGEQRLAMLATCNTMTLHIVYTLRGMSVRIISARKANRKERESYERG